MNTGGQRIATKGEKIPGIVGSFPPILNTCTIQEQQRL